jgi:hypothetical protein
VLRVRRKKAGNGRVSCTFKMAMARLTLPGSEATATFSGLQLDGTSTGEVTAG